MRFRITSQKWSDLYTLYLGETEIPVRNPSLKKQWKNDEGITWTWLDGTEYAVRRPRWPDGQIQILADDEIICCGQVFYGMGKLSEAIANDRVWMSRWEFFDQIITLEGSDWCLKLAPRKITLKLQDKVRIAVYMPHIKRCISNRITYRGVLRDDIPKPLVPIIFGIILATLHSSRWMASA